MTAPVDSAQPAQAACRFRAIEAIVMGGSAGALEPMLRLVAAMPPAMFQPVVVVLHLPERREGRLPTVFQQRSRRRVLEAQDKQKLEPHTLYIAAASYHLAIEQDRSLSLCDEPPFNFSRPSIDVLFRSAADVFKRGLAAFLFSGASNDGAEGLAAVHQRGGLTVVQSPEDADFPTMPRAAIDVQPPHRILTREQMPSLLLAIAEARPQ